MTTNLDETKLQVIFLPINLYVEDTVVVSMGLERENTSSSICSSNSETKSISIYPRELFNCQD